jgi:hypothetical protein
MDDWSAANCALGTAAQAVQAIGLSTTAGCDNIPTVLLRPFN